MQTLLSNKQAPLSHIALALAIALPVSQASADAVTDWNLYTALATKGATSISNGLPSAALNSNVATRIAAIEARAVFDAVNAVNNFSATYYYSHPAPTASFTANSASAAAIAAAHDVLIALQPAAATQAWVDSQRNADLAALGLTTSDPGYSVGQAAAAAALAARAADFAQINTTYTPSTNITATGGVNATGNPGRGLWRPSNGGAGVTDPNTGAPSGFDAIGSGANVVPAAGINFNWKNVTPFSLSTLKKQQLVAAVPPSLKLDSAEYNAELAFVQSHGQEYSAPSSRTSDQLLQALYYKSDAELFVNEAARIASIARGLTLNQNAKLFALLDNALADARIAAFQSKYDLVFWRPITALNADASGAATAYTAWKPLATTPSHPSSTAGHSTTVAAGTEILRSFFGTDNIDPSAAPIALTTPTWIVGTNNGTGKLAPAIAATLGGQDGTTRNVSTFSQLQLENGQSRLYLGVHFGNDNYQGQTLGLSVADAIIGTHTDPASVGVNIYTGGASVASAPHLYNLLVSGSSNSGFYGL